ncbi:hypothetical protein F383_02680 [Gossypium arboreum]|uniref:Uncharacterized protein n=2 Tax=Gossypium arboreum TaxID=29729 RepID=A0A0B0PIG2_GOSAR|nr:hypothetical protein F383_02680 [Gossypium arboreum]
MKYVCPMIIDVCMCMNVRMITGLSPEGICASD